MKPKGRARGGQKQRGPRNPEAEWAEWDGHLSLLLSQFRAKGIGGQGLESHLEGAFSGHTEALFRPDLG